MSHDKENRKHLQCIVDEGAEAATKTQITKRKMEDVNGVTRKRPVRKALGDITTSSLSRENKDDRISAMRYVMIADEKQEQALWRGGFAVDEEKKKRVMELERIAEYKKERKLQKVRIAEEKKEKALRLEEHMLKQRAERQKNMLLKKKMREESQKRTEATNKFNAVMNDTSTKYPLLRSIQFPCSMDAYKDKELLNKLLDRIIAEFDEMGEEYEARTGSEVTGRYYRMFHASSQVSFDSAHRKSNHIFNSMIEFGSKYNTTRSETKEPCAAEFVIDMLRRSYPNSFQKVLKDAKMTSSVKRLNVVQTASILEDTTTSVKCLYRINKHFNAHWGMHPFCAKKDLINFTKQDRPKLFFGTFEYEKKEAIDKNTKKVKKVGKGEKVRKTKKVVTPSKKGGKSSKTVKTGKTGKTDKTDKTGKTGKPVKMGKTDMMAEQKIPTNRPVEVPEMLERHQDSLEIQEALKKSDIPKTIEALDETNGTETIDLSQVQGAVDSTYISPEIPGSQEAHDPSDDEAETQVNDTVEEEEKKKPAKEKVQYCYYDGVDAFEKYVGRQILFDVARPEDEKEPCKLPTYGYDIEFVHGKPEDNGCYSLFGTDHGGDYSQTAMRILLNSSEERRKTGCADFGTITIPLMQILCKKDPPDILALTSKVVNPLMEKLRTSKLVAIKDEHGVTLRCKLVPRAAHSFSCEDGKRLSYMIGSELLYVDIDEGFLGTKFTCWVALESFKVKSLNDILAAFTIWGRHGHASCKCGWCDLTKDDWIKKLRKGTPITLATLDKLYEDLKNGEVNSIGVNGVYLWITGPEDSLVPIMHISLGLVNDWRNALIAFGLLHIDEGGPLEKEKKSKAKEAEEKVLDCKSRADALAQAQHLLKEESRAAKKILISARNMIKSRQTWVQKNNDNLTHPKHEKIKRELPGMIIKEADAQLKVDTIKANMDANAKALKVLEEVTKATKAECRELKKAIKDLITNRKKCDGGVDIELDAIFQSFAICVQNWHGGSLTYGACRTLMKKCNDVMNEVNIAFKRRLRERRSRSGDDSCSVTSEDADKTVELYSDMLKVMNAMFNHARIIAPTCAEVKRVKRSQNLYKKLQAEIGLPETPKSHTNITHLVEQILKYGGLGDKNEEWLEKLHQLWKKMMYLTQRMTSGWKSQMETAHNYIWRDSNPFVQECSKFVHESTKRNIQSRPLKVKSELMEERKECRWGEIAALESKYFPGIDCETCNILGDWGEDSNGAEMDITKEPTDIDLEKQPFIRDSSNEEIDAPEDEINVLGAVFEYVLQQNNDSDADGFSLREEEDDDCSILSMNTDS